MNKQNNPYNSLDNHDALSKREKLPIEVGFGTLIRVFFRRFRTILFATGTTLFFFAFAWILSDYSQAIAALFAAFFLSVSGTIILLLAISFFRQSATSFDIFLKRVFDTLVTLMALIVLAPLLALIAIAIRIDSKGPILYQQERIGKNGRKINLLKYRTMRVNGSEIQKTGISPRITRVGAFLRKYNLDELPLMFNVLRGDMSLVGPRALLPIEVEKYEKNAFDTYKRVPPGITGPWQVTGRWDSGYEERSRLDTYYVNNWSLWLDIAILAKTVAVVLRKQGAY